MNTTYIYLVTNCYNDPNKVYIGKTKNTRKNNHKYTFGYQINYDYIDKVNSLDKKDWKPLEIKWIQHYKNLGYEVLNKNNGGGGPSFLTDEIEQKISKSNKGRKLSQSTKNKMRLSKIGKPSNHKNCKESLESRIKKSQALKGKPSPKKGNKYGPNLKLKGRISPNRGPNPKLSASKKGKQNNGVKILDIRNNIMFNSKVKCAQYNGFNINKMRKLVDENIYYKRLK